MVFLVLFQEGWLFSCMLFHILPLNILMRKFGFCTSGVPVVIWRGNVAGECKVLGFPAPACIRTKHANYGPPRWLYLAWEVTAWLHPPLTKSWRRNVRTGEELPRHPPLITAYSGCTPCCVFILQSFLSVFGKSFLFISIALQCISLRSWSFRDWLFLVYTFSALLLWEHVPV